MHKKVLILGGTGAMGEPLSQVLADKQYNVYVTSRSSHKSEKNLTYLLGNAHDRNFLEEILCEYFDFIVDFMEYRSLEEFRDLLYIKLDATSQYVYCSSGRVYDDSEDILCEDSPLLSGIIGKNDQYAANKIEQERELKNSGYNNWTIIRPYLTYNIERLQLGNFEKEAWLYRAMHKRTILFPKRIVKRVTTMTYGCDVGIAIEKLLGNEKAYSNVIQIATGEFMNWGKILDIYLSVLEEKLSYRPNVLLYEEDYFPISSDRKQNRRFNNSKLRNLCEVDFIKMEEGLRKCINSFIDEQREFKEISWYLEGKMDSLTGEVASIEEIVSWKDRLTYVMTRFGDYEVFNGDIKGDILLQWREWISKLAQEDCRRMENVFEKKKKIGIYAVSNMMRRIIGAYSIGKVQNKEIIIYDSAESKWGHPAYGGGYNVKEPIMSELYKLDVLIISSDRYYDEIYSKYRCLEERGIEIIAAKDILQ